ncbi:MAG TPA: pyruvate ferredoxin oxidoreductase [Patescibacteria group bacterium]|nr:pyruvate ferredoxin oxidoreductase [Patescibacteria group bacterium]
MKNKKQNNLKNKNILEGSRAVALTIKNIEPEVISAYPITPQTHIVEDLAKFKADGQADYEYVRAESEFAAASIILGASATGSRAYSATSSQGLLLMTEVVFNIAGLRLPVVMTVANRGVSSPITIWNDHQDAMTVRDAGWLIFFAENHQEAIVQHLLAYKVAEKLKLPAMVNMDGFVLTHSYEPVIIPNKSAIKKFLPKYKPASHEYLNPKEPVTMGSFARPQYYQEIRQDLHLALKNSTNEIEKEFKLLQKTVGKDIATSDNSALLEYYGPKKAKTVIVAMGSMVGTMKDISDEMDSVAILKIKSFRPFPYEAVKKALKDNPNIAVIEKATSLGAVSPLAQEINQALSTDKKNVHSFVTGLGGRDVTKEIIKKAIKITKKKNKSSQSLYIT